MLLNLFLTRGSKLRIIIPTIQICYYDLKKQIEKISQNNFKKINFSKNSG